MDKNEVCEHRVCTFLLEMDALSSQHVMVVCYWSTVYGPWICERSVTWNHFALRLLCSSFIAFFAMSKLHQRREESDAF